MNSKIRITRDYGMKDYYEYLLKTTDIKISNVKFNKVIGEINKEIITLTRACSKVLPSSSILKAISGLCFISNFKSFTFPFKH
jgi:hypothetical protein